MNKKIFYDTIRELLFKGSISNDQVKGLNCIIDYYCLHYAFDPNYLGYILGTAYHESGLKPIRENGLGQGLPYGRKFKMGGGPNRRVAYSTPNEIYYGRGFVQLTWYENYQGIGKLLKLDLLNYPDKVLEYDIAAAILVEGMVHGWFTGKKLSNYITSDTHDYLKARYIINGNDRAADIAGFSELFRKSLKASFITNTNLQ